MITFNINDREYAVIIQEKKNPKILTRLQLQELTVEVTVLSKKKDYSAVKTKRTLKLRTPISDFISLYMELAKAICTSYGDFNNFLNFYNYCNLINKHDSKLTLAKIHSNNVELGDKLDELFKGHGVEARTLMQAYTLCYTDWYANAVKQAHVNVTIR